jgi:hypothetical protein
VGIPAIQGALANLGSLSNLVHADRLNASLGEEVPRNLQNALPMLGCIAPFMPSGSPEQLRPARTLNTIVEYSGHSAPS